MLLSHQDLQPAAQPEELQHCSSRPGTPPLHSPPHTPQRIVRRTSPAAAHSYSVDAGDTCAALLFGDPAVAQRAAGTSYVTGDAPVCELDNEDASQCARFAVHTL